MSKKHRKAQWKSRAVAGRKGRVEGVGGAVWHRRVRKALACPAWVAAGRNP